MQEKPPHRAKQQESPGTTKTGVRKVSIDAERAGQRIDNFLRTELPGVPKGRVYNLLRRGEVRVNGGRVKAEHKLMEGDEVRIPRRESALKAHRHPRKWRQTCWSECYTKTNACS